MADTPVTEEATPRASGIAHYRYRFGSAEFDGARFELRVGGLAVEVQQKPLEILALLLAMPGEVVDKNRINNKVWRDRATGDAVLTNAVAKLRAALGEANADRIVTVPRVGYRFDGAVERIAVGRTRGTTLSLEVGVQVPGRPGYQLKQRLSNGANETWLAVQPRTGDRRVFKFAADGERLSDLKREVTLFRVLRESLSGAAGIVPIIDWNFEDAPYWIESRATGVNLLEWCAHEENDRPRIDALNREQRLNLFLQIADIVAAAHGVGVLHKDLKPANILIAEDAQVWRPYLTDFGSGRLIDSDVLSKLQITQMGLTMASEDAGSGTLLYMAPEILKGENATVQADVYSLGVILFQLIAGDLRRTLAPGWERDVADPLLQQDIAAATDVDVEQRLPTVVEFVRRLRALPERRLEAEHSVAVARARAATELRLAKTRARRPWLVAAAVALCVGSGVSLMLYLQQRATNAALRQQVEISEALNDLLRNDLVGAANPNRAGRADMTVADALTSTARQVEVRFGQRAPAIRGSLHAAMQQALADLSRSQDAAAQGRLAVSALAQASPVDLVALQNARLRLALDLTQLSELDEANKIIRDIEAGGSPVSTGDEVAPRVFNARLLFVKAWTDAGDLSMQRSTERLKQAFALVEDLNEQRAPGRWAIMFGLADNLSMLRELSAAEALYRRLYAEQVSAYGEGDVRPLYTLVGLGRTLALRGDLEEARPMLNKAAQGLSEKLGGNHRQALTARDQLAEIRMMQADYAGAAEDWRIVYEGFVALLGATSSYSITVETNRALALQHSIGPQAAVPLLRDAYRRARTFLPPDAPQVQQIRYALADCHLALGDREKARVLLAGLAAAQLDIAQPESDWPERLRVLMRRASDAGANQVAND